MADDTRNREDHGAAGAGSDARPQGIVNGGFASEANLPVADSQAAEADRAMLGSPQLQQARSVDVFELIARNLLNQTAVITAPGATDLRWASVIAQAYREGFAAMLSQHRGGVIFRLTPDGHMEIIALEN